MAFVFCSQQHTSSNKVEAVFQKACILYRIHCSQFFLDYILCRYWNFWIVLGVSWRVLLINFDDIFYKFFGKKTDITDLLMKHFSVLALVVREGDVCPDSKCPKSDRFDCALNMCDFKATQYYKEKKDLMTPCWYVCLSNINLILKV